MNAASSTASLTLALVSSLLLNGCGRAKPYQPVEPSAEQLELKAQLAPHRERLKQAFSTSEDYALVAILDREHTIKDLPEWGTLTRLLILHREQLDVDDYHFSLPGKEADEEGQLQTVLGEMFWIDKEGQVLFDDYDQPPGTEMVVEWFVQSGVAEASLHFGGNPCLTVRLAE